jgi:hypothetical protein
VMRCGRGWRLSPMRIRREGAQLQIRGTWSAGPGDDQARFLADLRALRDSAAIGFDELAARAHYPSDILKEAENGPYLPGLPILTAYVRACEGDVLDWEERWRRLNPEVADDPDLPVRPAGASPAAVAGARAGVGVGPPDVYDPERINAALRGNQARPGQDSRRANDQGISALAHGAARPDRSDRDLLMDSGTSRDNGANWGANSGWDTPADPGITSANGNHSARHADRGPFDAAFNVVPDPAEHTEAAQDQDFSWLDNSTPESRPAEPADRGFAWLDRADTGLSAQPEAASAPAPEPAVTERIPWHQADGRMPQERTDFWAKPAAPGSASSDLRRPAPAPRAEEPAIGRASWPARADTAATSTPRAAETAQRTATDATTPGAAAAAQPLGLSGSGLSGSAAQATGSQRDNRRQDRLFPMRLLAVIIFAALIGSALVLLLK